MVVQCKTANRLVSSASALDQIATTDLVSNNHATCTFNFALKNRWGVI